MSSASDKPSVVQGNNLLQGSKEVDKTETNTKKESNETEANTEEHRTSQEKQASHMKENSVRLRMKVPTLQKEFTCFEYRYGGVPIVPYVKQQGCNRSEYVRFLNPIT